jgi:hypothetical protein
MTCSAGLLSKGTRRSRAKRRQSPSRAEIREPRACRFFCSAVRRPAFSAVPAAAASQPAGVLVQGLRADRGAPGGAVLLRGLLQRQQRVDRLPRPDDVGVRAGLGDCGQLAEHVRAAQSVPGHAVVAVIGRPGVVAGDAAERGQHPGRVHAVFPGLSCTVTSACFPDEAEWTQARRPATRNPVSSKCATPAAASAPRMTSSAGATAEAIFLVMEARAPGGGRSRTGRPSPGRPGPAT